MQKRSIPIALTALLPVAYGIKKLIENNSTHKNEMKRSIAAHFKDEKDLLKLDAHQRKEIYSILKDNTRDANTRIKQVLKPEQASLYEKLRKKMR